MIHLNADHKAIVDEILRFYLPQARIFCFGSRATGKNLRPQSDLDLLVDMGTPLDRKLYYKVRDAFSLSDLPMRVDLVDAQDIGAEFRQAIAADLTAYELSPVNQ